jgi:hypothetical protein
LQRPSMLLHFFASRHVIRTRAARPT